MFASAICSPCSRRSRTKARHKLPSPTHPPPPNKPLEGDNDQAPYNIFTYPGGAGNGPQPMVGGDAEMGDGRGMMAGFEAMLGRVEFEIKSPLPNDTYAVVVEVAPGPYRGVEADVM